MNLSIQRSDAFGYHTRAQLEKKISLINEGKPPTEKELTRATKIINLMTVASYIPIIGTILGIAKLVFIGKVIDKAEEKPKDVAPFVAGHKIRAWIELTSLGFLLLVPDLIFTINRNTTGKAAKAV